MLKLNTGYQATTPFYYGPTSDLTNRASNVAEKSAAANHSNLQQQRGLFQEQAHKAFDLAQSQHSKQIQAILTGLKDLEPHFASLEKFKSFSNFAIVGIGGSSLGLQVLQEYFYTKKLVFFENVDALEFEQQVQDLDLSKTVWIFISKSGETIETLATLELLQQLAQEKSFNLKQNSIVITENKKSSLRNWAQTNQVYTIDMPIEVGGRYSVLTSVGLVPAFLLGLDVKGLISGAALAHADRANIETLVAKSIESFSRNEYITVLWCYSSRFRKFGLWWQQLWAESLSKKVKRDGSPAPLASTPLPLIGATDQHSVLQQIMEGQKDKFVLFLRNRPSEAGSVILKKSSLTACEHLQNKSLGALLAAEADATQMSLDAVGVSNMTLAIEEHSEKCLGYLFMFFQLAVLTLGEALGINPVDQPGVEHGKKICKELLATRAH